MLTDLAVEAFQKGPSLQKRSCFPLFCDNIWRPSAPLVLYPQLKEVLPVFSGSSQGAQCQCPSSCTTGEWVTLNTQSCYVITQGEVERALGLMLLSGSVPVAIA